MEAPVLRNASACLCYIHGSSTMPTMARYDQQLQETTSHCASLLHAPWHPLSRDPCNKVCGCGEIDRKAHAACIGAVSFLASSGHCRHRRRAGCTFADTCGHPVRTRRDMQPGRSRDSSSINLQAARLSNGQLRSGLCSLAAACQRAQHGRFRKHHVSASDSSGMSSSRVRRELRHEFAGK